MRLRLALASRTYPGPPALPQIACIQCGGRPLTAGLIAVGSRVRAPSKARRYQRKMARQVHSSRNREKTKEKLARTRNYQTRVTQDWAHKTSYQLVTSCTRIHVFEQLRIQQMTKKPKAKMAPESPRVH